MHKLGVFIGIYHYGSRCKRKIVNETYQSIVAVNKPGLLRVYLRKS